MQQKYLILVGASGTGKSTIRQILVNFNPAMFTTVIQHTTRPRRAYEAKDMYVFDTKTQFEEVSSKLMGKCHIKDYVYGSEPMPEFDSRVGVIILNQEGLQDFKAWASAKGDVIYRIVGIYRPPEEAIDARLGERDEEYIRSEYQIYNEADYIFDNDFESIPPGEVVNNFSLLGKALNMASEACQAEALFKAWCKDGRFKS